MISRHLSDPFCLNVFTPLSLQQTELDKVHKVWMGVGNGLRQDVWRDFHGRFGNVKMCEVYGSTEGNLCFLNHIGKVGTVGRSNFIYRVSEVTSDKYAASGHTFKIKLV